MAILTCENASFSYDGRTVLEGVDFALNAGDYLCVVGENGSGKSTLIRGLLSLKAPASGKITLGDGLKRSEIGYLPQQTEIQRDFPASVREVVLSGCLNSLGGRLFYSDEDKRRAQENLERIEGMDVVNVGLGAVLYDITSHQYYSPNTNTTATVGEDSVIEAQNAPNTVPNGGDLTV